MADEDSSWIGVQKLGKQINIFINEATITKQNYESLFTDTINTQVDLLPGEKQAINEEILALGPEYSV